MSDFSCLGFVGHNKELFIFDDHIRLDKDAEKWLSSIEATMKDSIRMSMKNAIERFPTEPLEEWVLDYPQQVSITVLHLILS